MGSSITRRGRKPACGEQREGGGDEDFQRVWLTPMKEEEEGAAESWREKKYSLRELGNFFFRKESARQVDGALRLVQKYRFSARSSAIVGGPGRGMGRGGGREGERRPHDPFLHPKSLIEMRIFPADFLPCGKWAADSGGAGE